MTADAAHRFIGCFVDGRQGHVEPSTIPRFLATIDFGTTHCSVAYLLRPDLSPNPSEVDPTLLKLDNAGNRRVPSCILFDPNGRNIAFGNEAREQYADLNRDLRPLYYYFEHVKRNLQDIDRDQKISDMNGKQFFLLDVIAHILHHLKCRLLTILRDFGYKELRASDFDWMITVPAIWNLMARKLMLKAGHMAGLCSDSEPPPIETAAATHRPPEVEKSSEKLSLILEPESAAIHCRHKAKVASKGTEFVVRPEKYIIVDIGGGTVDITSHAIVDGCIVELAPPAGNFWGGTTVNVEFLEFLEKFVNDPKFSRYIVECSPEIQTRHKADLNELTYTRFEKLKRRFGSPQASNSYIIEFPRSFLKMYQGFLVEKESALNSEGEISVEVEEDGAVMRIYDTKMKEFFQPAIDGIMKLIESHLEEHRIAREIDTIYWVGGFGGCEYLRNQLETVIEATFQGCMYQFPVPPEPEFAVVLGAHSIRCSPKRKSNTDDFDSALPLNVINLNECQLTLPTIRGRETDRSEFQSMSRDPEEENKTIRSKYGNTLKEKYRSGIPTFLTLQWPPPPTLKVFNLAMISQRELQYGADDELVRLLLKGNVSDAVRQRNEVTLEQISDNLHSRGRKVILIEGAPGVGKSTLAWHLCKMWEAGKLFQEFEIVLFVQLHEPVTQSARTLEDLFPAESLSKKKEAISAIQYCGGHQVLIVLDSWDEFPPGLDQDSIISELICNPSKLNMQFSALIITSRPVATGWLQHYTSTRIQIAGFVQSEVKRYFTETIKDPQMVQKLSEQLKERPIIEASCYLPLNTVIIAHIFLVQNHTLPMTLHGVFTSLVLCCIIRHMERYGRRLKIASLDCLPLDIQEPFNNLCTLAYHGVRKNKATFSEEDLQLFNLPTELTTLSLMQGVASFSTFGESTLYNFLHLSTQELLAAFYISKMQPKEQIKIFSECFEQPRFANVFKFYAAFTKFQNKGIQDMVSRIANSKNETLLLTLFQCLYEAQDDRLCQFVASQLEEKLMLSRQTLSPMDCLSVGHFVRSVCSTATEEFKLTLQIDKLDDYSATLLVRELQPEMVVTTGGIPNLYLKLVKGYEFIAEHGKVISKLGPYLNVVDLQQNQISDEHCAALGKGLKHCTKLEHLNLGNNRIGDDGASCLAKAMVNMVNLQVLDLGNNRIGDDGASCLAKAMETMVNLQELYLYRNQLSNGSVETLTHLIMTAKCLKKLYLWGNQFTWEGEIQLKEATKETVTLALLNIELVYDIMFTR